MNVVDVPINELIPTEYNPRDCTPEEFEAIKESITRFSFVEPIVVNDAPNRKNIVIGGHQRLKVAKALNHTTMPVVYVTIADEAKEKELNLRLNQNTGHWDWEKLFANFPKDMLLDIGFTEEDFAFAENQWDRNDERVDKTKTERTDLMDMVKVICKGEIKNQVKADIQQALTKYGDQVKID